MISCILIFNAQKAEKRKGKVLFIEAENEVTRKNAQSFLEPKHINRMLNAYSDFKDEDGYCKVISNDEILRNDGKLSVSLYVEGEVTEYMDVNDAIKEWSDSHINLMSKVSTLNGMIANENN